MLGLLYVVVIASGLVVIVVNALGLTIDCCQWLYSVIFFSKILLGGGGVVLELGVL